MPRTAKETEMNENEKAEALLIAKRIEDEGHTSSTVKAARTIRMLVTKLEASQKEVARYSVYDEVISEIDRRADKEWCLGDGCDFTVTITHEQYQAIDAAKGNGQKETP